MRLDPDARLPISNDVQGLKTRLHDVFRDVAIKVNSILAQTKAGTTLSDYADDTAAATGGVSIGEFYRTGSTVKQRIS